MSKVNAVHLQNLATIFDGINNFRANGLIRIEGNTMSLYPQIWSRNPEAFMANAYRYFRLKLKRKEGMPVYFKDIETNRLIGKFVGGKAVLC